LSRALRKLALGQALDGVPTVSNFDASRWPSSLADAL
jgi:hypothetical protein